MSTSTPAIPSRESLIEQIKQFDAELNETRDLMKSYGMPEEEIARRQAPIHRWKKMTEDQLAELSATSSCPE